MLGHADAPSLPHLRPRRRGGWCPAPTLAGGRSSRTGAGQTPGWGPVSRRVRRHPSGSVERRHPEGGTRGWAHRPTHRLRHWSCAGRADGRRSWGSIASRQEARHRAVPGLRACGGPRMKVPAPLWRSLDPRGFQSVRSRCRRTRCRRARRLRRSDRGGDPRHRPPLPGRIRPVISALEDSQDAQGSPLDSLPSGAVAGREESWGWRETLRSWSRRVASSTI
jgi:hypothetical protein